MKRPRSTDYLLGHRASVVLTSGAAAFTCLACAAQAVSWLVPAFALLVCKASFAAKRRLVTYRDWRAAWDDMAGVQRPSPEAPKEPAAPERKGAKAKATRRPVAWIPLGVWVLLTGWLFVHAGEPLTMTYDYASIGFLGLSAWGAGALLVRLGRRIFRPALPSAPALSSSLAAPELTPQGDHIVSQSLPVPRAALPPGHVRDVLPDYCRELLARKPPEATSGDSHAIHAEESDPHIRRTP